MNYSRTLPYRENRPLHICRHLLKDILRIDYGIKYSKYRTSIIQSKFIEKSTQTEDLFKNNCNIDNNLNNSVNSHFFRIQ